MGGRLASFVDVNAIINLKNAIQATNTATEMWLGVNFTNIFYQAFSYKSFKRSFFVCGGGGEGGGPKHTFCQKKNTTKNNIFSKIPKKHSNFCWPKPARKGASLPHLSPFGRPCLSWKVRSLKRTEDVSFSLGMYTEASSTYFISDGRRELVRFSFRLNQIFFRYRYFIAWWYESSIANWCLTNACFSD